jgi:hypothetical protein
MAWSLERVVSELQQLAAGGEVMTYAALKANGFGHVVTAAERWAGSLAKAMKLAGLTYARAKKVWSVDAVVAELRRLHADGVPLNSVELQRNGHRYLVIAARKYCGGWPAAVERAGLPAFVRGPWTSWEVVRDKLGSLHASGARMTKASMKALDLADLLAAAEVYAGSWNKALTKAGLPVVERHRKWTRDDVVAELRRLHDRDPSLNNRAAVRAGKRALVNAAVRYFGSWTAACAASVPAYTPLLTRWSRELIIDELRRRHASGEVVTSTAITRDDPALALAVRNHIGSWARAYRLAGLTPPENARPPTRVRWNEDMLLSAVLAANAGGIPLLARHFPGAFVTAMYRRFPSWPAAMSAAGLAEQYERDRRAAQRMRLRRRVER